MTSKDEKEIFEFLDSLPTDGTGNDSSAGAMSPNDAVIVDKSEGKSDADILNFLDELEGTNKAGKADKSPAAAEQGAEKATKDEVAAAESNENRKDQAVAPESVEDKGEEASGNDESGPVNDPITSIASWWSNTGSATVSTQLSSLWGTAQSIGEQAQKQAEDAIKKAREQSLEDNLRGAFKELGITGVRENINEMLTEEQREELRKLPLPDAKKALESLNSGLNMGLSLVGGTLSDVIEKINTLNNKDEIIEIVVVHDMKNFLGLSSMVKLNFEDVMAQQVDGSIDVKVIESGTAKSSPADGEVDRSDVERIDFSLFNGKGSDAEKLLVANMENEIKQRKKSEQAQDQAQEAKEGEGQASNTRKTTIFISLLAWTSSKDNSLVSSSAKDLTIDSHSTSSFTISCMLKDEEHGIAINAQSQPLPLKWAQWIEGNFEEGEKEDDIDPSEWVIGWITNAINNVIGVTSQSYIIKRMGY